MTRWIVGSSLKLRALVLAIAAGLVVVGITQLRHAPVDVLPEFTPTYVEIQTEALGLSANEVEELITAPIEADLLNGVEGVAAIRSKSVPGMSSVVLVFEKGADLYKERQLVQERLNQAHALPQVSRPPEMLQPLSSQSRVIMVALSAPKLSLVQQGVLARWTIRPRLMGVQGVANVEIWGQRERQLQVQVDPRQLRRHDVSLLQVIRTAGNAQFVSNLTFLEGSTPGTGGFIDTPSQRLGIQHVFPTATADDLAKVSVEGTGDARLRLGDVANVVEDHQPLIGDSVGKSGPGLLLVVEKLPGANTVAVTREVEDALDELRPGLSGMETDSAVYRPAGYIEDAIDNLTLALIIGGVLLILAVAAFLFEWRGALIALVSIPVSLIAAALVLDLFGATFNALVVAGLVVALVVIVDDAVAGTENIVRRLRERPPGDERPTARVVLEATLESRRPLVYATLVLLLAVVPFFVLSGVSGRMFGPLAISYGLAVLASVLVALTVAPALSVVVYSRTRRERRRSVVERRGSPVVQSVADRYQPALARLVRSPRTVFLAGAAVAVIGLVAVLSLEHSPEPSLLPTFKERTLVVHWGAPAGTSRPEMNRIVARATHELRGVRGVRDVGGHVGRAVSADQVVNINSGEIWVNLDPAADYDKTVRAVREVVDGYPGLRHAVSTYSQQRVREVSAMEDGRDDNHDGRDDTVMTTATEDGAPGARSDILVRLYGQDYAVLRRKADEVRRAVSSIDGVADPTVERQVQQPTLEIQVDLAAATRHGLKPGDIRRAATTLVSGLTVGSLFEQQKVFDVVVWGAPHVRHNPASISNLLIDTPRGGHVRLGDVARVSIRPDPPIIRRDSVQRRIDVGLDVSGRSLGAVSDEVERRIQRIAFPLEYHAEVLGPSAERHAADRRVLSVGIAAAVGALLLLQAAFGSWRLAALLMLSLPPALAGGALAAWVDGGVISLGSLVGFFAVLAITVRAGVMLIDRWQRLEQQEGEDFGAALVLRGAEERLSPIVLAAVATGLAVLPFVIFGSRPGLEIVHPMAIVIVGGLITSTLVSLFVLPALYLPFAVSRERVGAGMQVSASHAPGRPTA